MAGEWDLTKSGWAGTHFSDFRNSWLRGRLTQEDVLKYWMGHKPQHMSRLYSHLHEELEMRLEEAERVGYGFDLAKAVIVPNAPRK
jgi:hypothetical protein